MQWRSLLLCRYNYLWFCSTFNWFFTKLYVSSKRILCYCAHLRLNDKKNRKWVLLELDQVYCAWLKKGLLCLYILYWVSIGLVCLYILEKVDIWSGDTDASQTDRQQNIGLLSFSPVSSLSWVTQWANFSPESPFQHFYLIPKKCYFFMFKVWKQPFSLASVHLFIWRSTVCSSCDKPLKRIRVHLPFHWLRSN